VGLTAKTFKGLDKKRMKKRSGGGGDRVKVEDDKPNTVQFYVAPDEFEEFEQHGWQSGGNWNFVPCAGEGCPLCTNEDEKIRKTSYRFCAPVFDHKQKKSLILEGPQTMASIIFRRYEACERRRAGSFLRKVWDVTRFSGTPTTFDCEESESTAKNPNGLPERLDPAKYIQAQMDRYYENASADVSALDDNFDGDSFEEDEDWLDLDEEGEEAWDKESLLALKPSELKDAAAEFNIKVREVTRENRPKLIAAILRKQG
jgi:hypothetical protein